MNTKRIVWGGVAAGAVMLAGEIGIEPLLGPKMEQFFARLGLPVPGESAMIGLAPTVLALGLITVWLYAALVAQFGSGHRIAVLSGFVVWSLSCLLPNIVLTTFGLLEANLFWLWSAWPLVETVVAAVLGAAIYRHGRKEVRTVAV